MTKQKETLKERIARKEQEKKEAQTTKTFLEKQADIGWEKGKVYSR